MRAIGADPFPPPPHNGLRSLSLRRRYTTGRNDVVEEFFRPCLSVAKTYDRAVGFFSSTLYAMVGVSVSNFAARGGRMRLVCCPRLSPADINAITEGYVSRSTGGALIREMQDCMRDPVGRAVTSLLATLVACGALDLKISFRLTQSGIYHDKMGIFTDEDGDRLSFDGSSNESWMGWSDRGNYEGFHAFASWVDTDRVADDVEYFNSLWEGHEPGLQVTTFPDVARDELVAVSDPEGIEHAEQLVRDAVNRIRQRVEVGRPRLRDHQRDVLDDWARHDRRGLVEHATASGKTITALAAAEASLAAGYSTLIIVPSVVLLEQWTDATTRYFGSDLRILLAGGGHEEWRAGPRLHNFLEPGRRRLVLATLDTAVTDEFTRALQGIHPLTVIVDEVHRVGSNRRRRFLSVVDADWRLGLSATWEREGDPAGTDAISDYFGDVLHPIYTLQNAIRDGYLSPYRYVVHPLGLSEPERNAWLAFNARIGRALGASLGVVTESVRQMLIQRARIVKKAWSKSGLAAEVLKKEYREGDAWLVYCDDTDQLRAVRQALTAEGLVCMEYHRQVAGGGEDESLAEFERNGGIMLAIRCLDEGVDIPRIDHALVLASSTTRREFIQRRGRLLRVADRKFQAEIHDVLVDATGFDDPMSASFVRNEIARAQEFASSARDSQSALTLLERWTRRNRRLSAGNEADLGGADDDTGD